MYFLSYPVHFCDCFLERRRCFFSIERTPTDIVSLNPDPEAVFSFLKRVSWDGPSQQKKIQDYFQKLNTQGLFLSKENVTFPNSNTIHIALTKGVFSGYSIRFSKKDETVSAFLENLDGKDVGPLTELSGTATDICRRLSLQGKIGEKFSIVEKSDWDTPQGQKEVATFFHHFPTDGLEVTRKDVTFSEGKIIVDIGSGSDPEFTGCFVIIQRNKNGNIMMTLYRQEERKEMVGTIDTLERNVVRETLKEEREKKLAEEKQLQEEKMETIVNSFDPMRIDSTLFPPHMKNIIVSILDSIQTHDWERAFALSERMLRIGSKDPIPWFLMAYIKKQQRQEYLDFAEKGSLLLQNRDFRQYIAQYYKDLKKETT